MLDWLEGTVVGAVVGSALSVWWRKPARWLVQFAAGVFVGWWGGDYFIAFFGMPDTVETSRAVGSGLGLIGYSLLDWIMATNWGALAGKVLDKAASMRGAGK